MVGHSKKSHTEFMLALELSRQMFKEFSGELQEWLNMDLPSLDAPDVQEVLVPAMLQNLLENAKMMKAMISKNKECIKCQAARVLRIIDPLLQLGPMFQYIANSSDLPTNPFLEESRDAISRLVPAAKDATSVDEVLGCLKNMKCQEQTEIKTCVEFFQELKDTDELYKQVLAKLKEHFPNQDYNGFDEINMGDAPQSEVATSTLRII